jgi:hypothetical protein
MARNSKRLHVEVTTPLERHVRAWVNSRSAEYDSGAEGVLKDLFYGGCQSGMVGHLIYYHDTVKFYKRHAREIDAMLQELMADTGLNSPQALFGDKWDADDPFARDHVNQNLLAWFGFEETARKLADRAELDI